MKETTYHILVWLVSQPNASISFRATMWGTACVDNKGASYLWMELEGNDDTWVHIPFRSIIRYETTRLEA